MYTVQQYQNATSEVQLHPGSKPGVRVLARILKLPVQNSNSKDSARPDLATQLLHILIPTTFYSLLCQKGQFTLEPCPRRYIVRKMCYHNP